MEITFKDVYTFLCTGMGKIKLKNYVMKNYFASTHAMKTYGGVQLQLHSLLISPLDEGESLPYAPANFFKFINQQSE
jgi:hypothetical protein